MSPEADSAVGQLSKRVDELGVDVRDLRAAIDRLTNGVIGQQKLETRLTSLEENMKESQARKFQLKLAWVSPVAGAILGSVGVVLVSHI